MVLAASPSISWGGEGVSLAMVSDPECSASPKVNGGSRSALPHEHLSHPVSHLGRSGSVQVVRTGVYPCSVGMGVGPDIRPMVMSDCGAHDPRPTAVRTRARP